MDQPARALALSARRRVPAAAFAIACAAAACGPSAGTADGEKPFKPGWVRHRIDAHVAISAPPGLRFTPRTTPEHTGGVLHGDDVDVFLSAGPTFVYTMAPSPGDTVRPRQTLTIAGQPVPVEAWRREPTRFAGKPFELASLFEAGRIRVSAHAACRTEAACDVARDVIASIVVKP